MELYNRASQAITIIIYNKTPISKILREEGEYQMSRQFSLPDIGTKYVTN